VTPAEDHPRHRIETAANAIVADLADRLADPAEVVARMTADANVRTFPDGSQQQPWSALALTDGYPALALLYAELGHLDARYRTVAHTYLGHAAASSTEAPPGGLYAGPVALAFAASCAARKPAEYAGVLEPLDRSIAAWVPTRLKVEWERIEAGLAGTTFACYDVIGGMAGVGRYLLRRGGETRPALTEILSYLTALTRPCSTATQVPGWWVTHPPNLLTPLNGHGGHLNLGLAHGIPGPLVLLALAWQEGIRVPGQDEAIARIVDWLLDWRITDPTGPDWPATLEPADLAGSREPPPPSRSAWCYGAPGVARALQVAGRSLGVPGWTSVATAAVRRMLLHQPDGPYGVHDAGLCHGWAGLLHLARLMGMDARDPHILDATTTLAARLVDCYDEQAPFGFRATNPPAPGTVDLAGFLEGAAGIVLALLSYLDGGRPATGWDTALLVS
jgi:hypothetical protein